MYKASRRTVAVALAAASVALAFAVAPSQATYHGKNGRIAFRRYFDNNHQRSAIYTINIDGSAEQRITHDPKGSFDDQPDWSPDGSLIAFTRCPVNVGACAVYVMHANGTGLKRLSPVC